jgi:hypothetical protein
MARQHGPTARPEPGNNAMKQHFSAIAPKVWALLVAIGLFGILATLYLESLKAQPTIVLLIPGAQSLSEPVTQAWLDASREEGLSIVPMTDDEFMRYGGNHHSIAGVIVPDSVHKQASDLLVNFLHTYVKDGGNLFVAFDAALLDTEKGGYAFGQSRLSSLVGVRYAMYGELREKMFGQGPVYGTRYSAARLSIQPGKFDFRDSSMYAVGELTTYGYPQLDHSYYRTEPEPKGQSLLRSANKDAIVSTNDFGRGKVLFANLPLGYLKTRTDSYLLHRLLGYFAVDMLHQPRLAPVPNAQGGMVLNLHIDSNAAQTPLLQLEDAGWFNSGPFSIHVTAGPDTYKTGDNLGLNLDSNPKMREFLKRQVALGHEVGNHGGWNHNIFGSQATEKNRSEFEPYLERNHRSISAAIGRQALSYSAPMGNQPVWVTQWLQRNGFSAYYFTGDNGLGPTRSYYEGKRPESTLWAFPVSSFLKIATFEELDAAQEPKTGGQIGEFLGDLSSYAADQHVAKLFYFHPPAAARYAASLEQLMQQTSSLARQGRFRWYTMEQLATFLNRREQASWRVASAAGHDRVLAVSSSASLRELSWIFPIGSASRFRVTKGVAAIRKDAQDWIVTAGDCTSLEVELQYN